MIDGNTFEQIRIDYCVVWLLVANIISIDHICDPYSRTNDLIFGFLSLAPACYCNVRRHSFRDCRLMHLLVASAIEQTYLTPRCT